MSDKIELGMLCGVLQSNFSRLSQSESRTLPCHVRILYYCPEKKKNNNLYCEYLLNEVYLRVLNARVCTRTKT